MSIFSSIMGKIFHHPNALPAADASNAPPAGASGIGGATAFDDSASPASPSAGAAAPAMASAAAPAQPVDVGAVLSQIASTKGGGGNYQTSIVDLLKLLDLDSSLDARKELGQELGVHAGADGSAEQNMALQKAVMQKLAENGGKVPDSMKA